MLHALYSHMSRNKNWKQERLSQPHSDAWVARRQITRREAQLERVTDDVGEILNDKIQEGGYHKKRQHYIQVHRSMLLILVHVHMCIY